MSWILSNLYQFWAISVSTHPQRDSYWVLQSSSLIWTTRTTCRMCKWILWEAFGSITIYAENEWPGKKLAELEKNKYNRYLTMCGLLSITQAHTAWMVHVQTEMISCGRSLLLLLFQYSTISMSFGLRLSCFCITCTLSLPWVSFSVLAFPVTYSVCCTIWYCGIDAGMYYM